MTTSLMAAISAAVSLLVAWRLGITSEVPAYLYLAVITGPLVVIDLREQRLPNVITLPSYPIVALLLLAAAYLDGTWSTLGRAALGGAILLAVYAVLHLVNPGGMGMGDVKLAGPLGALLAWASWDHLLWGTFAGFALAAVVGLALIATRRATRRSALPFGPFMLAGAWLVLLTGVLPWSG